MAKLPVTLSDIQDAARRIFKSGYIWETPLLSLSILDDIAGFASLSIKDETTHPIGVFKLRGAYNHFLQLTEEQKKAGVFAVSSGNHAQAVAYAARQFQVAATILMPADAPRLKLERTRSYGADVITYDRASQDRDATARSIAEERGLHFIHPYNDPRTIAGQGTVGIEIRRQIQHMGIVPDVIIVPCSGGGLASGVALTRDLYATPPEIYTAEPEGFDDTRRSLESGKIVANESFGPSVCDALLAPSPGSNAFPILQEQGVRGLTASEDEVAIAMSLAARFAERRLEPSGAMALACAIRHREKFAGKNVVVVASGANVDPEVYTAMAERGYRATGKVFPELVAY